MSSTKYPTYEWLQKSGRCRPSVDFARLRWYLSGPILAKIHVLESAFDATSPQSPYQQSPDSDSFHSISTSPISYPPVSSITVTVGLLDNWAESWEDVHIHCAEPERERVTTLPDGTKHLERCCGTDRPGPSPSLTVTAGGGDLGPGFVTIHDYVTAVHPWLLAHEADIRLAIGAYPKFSLKAEFEIFVYPKLLSPLYLRNTRDVRGENKERWWARLASDAEKWAMEGESGQS